MTYAPKVEHRDELNYAGIRTQVPMSSLSRVIPDLTDQVFAWLNRHDIEPAGASLVRYHVINMEGLLDIEMGVPVAAPVSGDEQVKAGVIPAGRYASLVYTGVSNGIAGNGALLKWGAEQGLAWDRWDVPEGDAFGGRYESLLSDPDAEPDMAKWQTEVAIRLADA